MLKSKFKNKCIVLFIIIIGILSFPIRFSLLLFAAATKAESWRGPSVGWMTIAFLFLASPSPPPAVAPTHVSPVPFPSYVPHSPFSTRPFPGSALLLIYVFFHN